MDAEDKAFDFAADLSKQLITLASAILAVTITFSKDTPVTARVWAFAAWLAFIVSIVFGIAALATFTAILQPKKLVVPQTARPTIWSGTLFPQLQVAAFLLAVALTIAFGWKAMASAPKEDASKRTAPTYIFAQPCASLAAADHESSSGPSGSIGPKGSKPSGRRIQKASPNRSTP
jgi:hypothetical protein